MHVLVETLSVTHIIFQETFFDIRTQNIQKERSIKPFPDQKSQNFSILTFNCD
jgi:hypothetical protein